MFVPSTHPRRRISSKKDRAAGSSSSDSPAKSTTTETTRAGCANASRGATRPATNAPSSVLLVETVRTIFPSSVSAERDIRAGYRSRQRNREQQARPAVARQPAQQADRPRRAGEALAVAPAFRGHALQRRRRVALARQRQARVGDDRARRRRKRPLVVGGLELHRLGHRVAVLARGRFARAQLGEAAAQVGG